MRPTTHAVTGSVAGLILFVFIPSWGIIQSIVFVLTSVFIDIDHVICFVCRTRSKRWNIVRIVKEAYRSCTISKEISMPLVIFHTVEFLVSIKIIDFFVKNDFISSILVGIFWGCVLHIILDFLKNASRGVPFGKAFFIIEYCIRRNQLNKK